MLAETIIDTPETATLDAAKALLQRLKDERGTRLVGGVCARHHEGQTQLSLDSETWFTHPTAETLACVLTDDVPRFNWQDVMLDVETLGTKAQAVFMELTAVQFDRFTGEPGLSVTIPVKLDSTLAMGLKIDGSTAAWWLRQSDTTRLKMADAIENGYTLEQALGLLRAFFSVIPRVVLWGNGARFDIGILANAYEQLGETLPWKHWNEMDVRTVVAIGRLFGLNPKYDLPFEGEPHNSLDDCLHQIKYVSYILRQLKVSGKSYRYTDEEVRSLALQNGFKLKTQPDGSEDLNPYVYDFARALLGEGNPA